MDFGICCVPKICKQNEFFSLGNTDGSVNLQTRHDYEKWSQNGIGVALYVASVPTDCLHPYKNVSVNLNKMNIAK